MSSLRCLIVDDEPPARLEMRRLLAAHPEIEIAGEAEGVEAALELAARLKPRVIFLDVHLRGETGFDLVARLPEPAPRIVFVTAYDRYAVRGFECNALDYLLKPVEPARLAETVRRLGVERPSPPAAGADDLLFLKSGSTARFVPWREVSHIEADGNYTEVFLEDGTTMLMIRSLRQWLPLVPPGLFLQVHRNVLVRLDAIRGIESVGGGRELVMARGKRLPAGRSFWPALKAALPGS